MVMASTAMKKTLAITSFLIGAFLIIGGAIKASHYGWLHEKTPFTVLDHTLHLGGYSVVPIALEVGVLFLLVSGLIWMMMRRSAAKSLPAILSSSHFRTLPPDDLR
jgi:uncharacterized membrane protein HdeD (DUF308 family)